MKDLFVSMCEIMMEKLKEFELRDEKKNLQLKDMEISISQLTNELSKANMEVAKLQTHHQSLLLDQHFLSRENDGLRNEIRVLENKLLFWEKFDKEFSSSSPSEKAIEYMKESSQKDKEECINDILWITGWDKEAATIFVDNYLLDRKIEKINENINSKKSSSSFAH